MNNDREYQSRLASRLHVRIARYHALRAGVSMTFLSSFILHEAPDSMTVGLDAALPDHGECVAGNSAIRIDVGKAARRRAGQELHQAKLREGRPKPPRSFRVVPGAASSDETTCDGDTEWTASIAAA